MLEAIASVLLAAAVILVARHLNRPRNKYRPRGPLIRNTWRDTK